MDQSKSMFVKAVFFFVIGVVLASLFIWCLIQGITIHLIGDTTTPMMYYVAAWLAGVGGFTLYMQARSLFHFAKISGE